MQRRHADRSTFANTSMIETADIVAHRYGISREAQDAFSLRSQQRTASAQQNAATSVSNPKPGDLVFFGSPAWHVGIYTGNGMMIDSPRRGKSTSERPIFDGVSGYGRF